ncbi:hypothetical protein LOZ53_002477 [Ophidiomyces ophidiicola]|nr:hypothetical protein LOZ55_003843 [Ophidiomyces ophidiicola]KAI1990397.1 hypothetical protein LOZ54_002498 [Ophidiomyces ophidiicola]KAI1992419.1 hypothetical protein LOZ53_002477 [Ophidiomyces ophidiicola]KAI1998431.1 hypothetical protein LOZ51_002162 [Ophidiomyces ophidiicola]
MATTVPMNTIPAHDDQAQEPAQLSLVAWGEQHVGHWAIFVPSEPGAPDGRLVHIGVRNKSTSCVSVDESPHLLIHNFNVAHSGARRSTTIPNARATRTQVEDAARYVHANYTYVLLTTNCQSFALRVLERLNQLYPENVTASAVLSVRNRGTASTWIAGIMNRTPLNYAQG